jgi:hypothetical protein
MSIGGNWPVASAGCVPNVRGCAGSDALGDTDAVYRGSGADRRPGVSG